MRQNWTATASARIWSFLRQCLELLSWWWYFTAYTVIAVAPAAVVYAGREQGHFPSRTRRGGPRTRRRWRGGGRCGRKCIDLYRAGGDWKAWPSGRRRWTFRRIITTLEIVRDAFNRLTPDGAPPARVFIRWCVRLSDRVMPSHRRLFEPSVAHAASSFVRRVNPQPFSGDNSDVDGFRIRRSALSCSIVRCRWRPQTLCAHTHTFSALAIRHFCQPAPV